MKIDDLSWTLDESRGNAARWKRPVNLLGGAQLIPGENRASMGQASKNAWAYALAHDTFTKLKGEAASGVWGEGYNPIVFADHCHTRTAGKLMCQN